VKDKKKRDPIRDLKIIIIALVVITGVLLLFRFGSVVEKKTESAEKPVIYVYSDKENQDVDVIFTTKDLTCEYPKRTGSIWYTKTQKDGSVKVFSSAKDRKKDKNGKTYNYLFWEDEYSRPDYKLEKGFCVKGEETASFLEEKLEEIGLNKKEANEFIVYWLPRMEKNPYNIISFQTNTYTKAYPLATKPKTKNILRVFMTFSASENRVSIQKQNLKKIKGSFEREGIHIVEWGGAEICEESNSVN